MNPELHFHPEMVSAAIIIAICAITVWLQLSKFENQLAKRIKEINAGEDASHKVTVFPTPLVVSEKEEFVLRRDFIDFQGAMEKRLTRMENQVNNHLITVEESLRTSRADLHKSLAEIITQGEARKKEITDHINDLDNRNENRVGEVHNRINGLIENMPQRIIDLLRTTGAIGKLPSQR